MRFMMLIELTEYPQDAVPDAKGVEAMMKYNEQLAKAGVLLALDGLQSPAAGARISFHGGKPIVTDGPYTETKEIVGGYWMIQVKSKAEAIEWAKRCPAKDTESIELRQVFELTDFPADVQRAADNQTVRAAVDRA